MIATGLKRYFVKRKLANLVLGLPTDLQSGIMRDLLGIIDLPDKKDRVSKVHEVFETARKHAVPSQEWITPDTQQQEYLRSMKLAASNVIAPVFPMAHIAIDHNLLEQKAAARLSMEYMKNEIMQIKEVGKFHLFAAGTGLFLSTIANYLTVSAKFGNDWLGGNEMMTGFFNFIFSVVLNLFEAVGLYMLLHFLPDEKARGIARRLGMVGACLVIAGVVTIIFSRTEMGSSLLTDAQTGGRVE